MGGLTLIREAREAGLTLEARDDRLVVTGPPAAEPLAGRLLARKPEVLAALRAESWFTTDPRPDLAEDSALWGRLLARAFALDGDDPTGLCGALHGLRCCGAALVAEGGRLRLTAGEMGDDEYAALRRAWLIPHADALRLLLRDAASDAA